jgi:hypothetical protein
VNGFPAPGVASGAFALRVPSGTGPLRLGSASVAPRPTRTVPLSCARLVAALALGLVAGTALAGEAPPPGAAPDPRFVGRVALPGGAQLVVAEGDLEPRSIGSYSVRLYAAGDLAFPTDRFVSGLVRAREGFIERIVLDDLDGDGRPELVVVIRSAGTGGAVSADAYALDSRRAVRRDGVQGLPGSADPLQALRARARPTPR